MKKVEIVRREIVTVAVKIPGMWEQTRVREWMDANKWQAWKESVMFWNDLVFLGNELWRGLVSLHTIDAFWVCVLLLFFWAVGGAWRKRIDGGGELCFLFLPGVVSFWMMANLGL
jgi:hypothetical protein